MKKKLGFLQLQGRKFRCLKKAKICDKKEDTIHLTKKDKESQAKKKRRPKLASLSHMCEVAWGRSCGSCLGSKLQKLLGVEVAEVVGESKLEQLLEV